MMNKEEWIAVGVKLFGIFLIVLAIVNLPAAVANLWLYLARGDTCTMDFGMLKEGFEITVIDGYCRKLLPDAVKSAFSVVLYSGFGFYFVRSGKLAKKVLDS